MYASSEFDNQLTGQILPAVTYGQIDPIPPLPDAPQERADYLDLITQRAAAVERTAARKDVLAIPDLYKRAEELASQLGIMAYGGATGLLGIIDIETDRMPRDEAQKRVERILTASGPARVSLVFTPGSGYGLLPEIRASLVGKLGYEPLNTQLADTTQFDQENGIKPKSHRRLSFRFKRT